MKFKLASLLTLTSILLAACAVSVTPSVVPTQAPSILPTMPPSLLPTMPSSPLVPGGGLITKPEADIWQNAPQAALQARADLAKRLQIDRDVIALVSAEHVDWPDGCLGIKQPGVMCTMVISPGYKVVLEANGRQYEYHTNESGSNVRLVGG